MEIRSVKIATPDGCNVILGQTHFIKSVEDLYEALVNNVPGVKFGIAFSEASGPCLVRRQGTDEELVRLASEKLLEIGAGHVFLLYMKNAYPVNVLNAIKTVTEVCNVYCATANPVEVLLAESDQGRGVLGVIDGFRPKGVESEADVINRKEFLRKTGYKL
ncbi:MAG: adenosine-specific kinase [Thaumarchaeota archaeon]|nr:adenosine-specific kinase [Nitrososphaerota archaeon]